MKITLKWKELTANLPPSDQTFVTNLQFLNSILIIITFNDHAEIIIDLYTYNSTHVVVIIRMSDKRQH